MKLHIKLPNAVSRNPGEVANNESGGSVELSIRALPLLWRRSRDFYASLIKADFADVPIDTSYGSASKQWNIADAFGKEERCIEASIAKTTHALADARNAALEAIDVLKREKSSRGTESNHPWCVFARRYVKDADIALAAGQFREDIRTRTIELVDQFEAVASAIDEQLRDSQKRQAPIRALRSKAHVYLTALTRFAVIDANGLYEDLSDSKRLAAIEGDLTAHWKRITQAKRKSTHE